MKILQDVSHYSAYAPIALQFLGTAIFAHAICHLLQRHNSKHYKDKDKHKQYEKKKMKKITINSLPYFVFISPLELMREFSDRKPIYLDELLRKYGQETMTVSLLPYWLQCVLVPICRLFKLCDADDLVVPHSVIVLTRDAKVAKRILSHTYSDKPLWLFKSLAILLSRPGFSQSNGLRSRHVRRTIGVALNKRNVERMSSALVNEYFVKWTDTLLERSLKNNSVDVSTDLIDIMLRGVVHSFFEYSMTKDESTIYLKQMKEAWKFKSTAYNMAFRSLTPGYKKVRHNMQIHVMGRRIFNQYKESGKTVHGSLIQHIIDDPNYIDDEDRINDCIILINSGHDSSAYTMAFFILDMCCHKDIQKQLRISLQNISEEGREHLPLLQNLIRESMRCHPVGGVGSMRTTTRNLELDDFVVPKHNLVQSNLYSILLNDKYYENPLKFDPSRWDTMDEEGLNAFIPFSAGKRNCIGSNFAVATIRKCLAYLFSRDTEFSLVDEGTTVFELTYKLTGLKIHARKIPHGS